MRMSVALVAVLFAAGTQAAAPSNASDGDLLEAPSPETATAAVGKYGTASASNVNQSPAAANKTDAHRARQDTLPSVPNAFGLKKWDGRPEPPALAVPVSTTGRHPDDALAGLRSPGAFRTVPATVVIDREVVQTAGEFSQDTARQAMLPLPPTNLRDDGGKSPAPRSEEGPAAAPPSATPDSAASEGLADEHLRYVEKCKSPRDLKSIHDITADISIKRDDLTGSKGLPPECPLGNEPLVPRNWQRTTFAWTAAATWHKPIYFEDEQLERYGHTFGPVTQSAVSAVKFFGTAPLLPYYMGVYPPRECIYDLGTYRPGSCAPYWFDPFPLSVRGAVNEGLFLGTLPAL